jgi:ATP/maltotriose-dependent transcriptional regulator MalT
VLRALAEPVPLTAVAESLFVSPNTLKTHAKRIYRALGVANRADAVEAGRRAGLL